MPRLPRHVDDVAGLSLELGQSLDAIADLAEHHDVGRAEARTAGDPGGPGQERKLEGGDIRVDRGAEAVPGARDVPGSTYSGSLWSNGSSLGMAPEGEGNIAYTDAYRECLRRLGF